MTDRKCADCVHYSHDTGSECRRHAPVLRLAVVDTKAAMIGDVLPAKWPQVSESDFCGEWSSSLQKGWPPREQR